MIFTTEIRFAFSQQVGDFRTLWMLKQEGLKTWNGYLEKGVIQWEEMPEGSLYDKFTPFMILPYRFPLQELIDALTNKYVLPPTKQQEIDAELKATKYHLEDMRKIALKI
jgi:hypothetical protein